MTRWHTQDRTGQDRTEQNVTLVVPELATSWQLIIRQECVLLFDNKDALRWVKCKRQVSLVNESKYTFKCFHVKEVIKGAERCKQVFFYVLGEDNDVHCSLMIFWCLEMSFMWKACQNKTYSNVYWICNYKGVLRWFLGVFRSVQGEDYTLLLVIWTIEPISLSKKARYRHS